MFADNFQRKNDNNNNNNNHNDDDKWKTIAFITDGEISSKWVGVSSVHYSWNQHSSLVGYNK